MRLIDADKLKENIQLEDDNVLGVLLRAFIDKQKTVDAVPVKHGHWIKKPWLIGTTYVCSRCQQYHVLDSHYCPECGAKMDEEETYEG